MGIKYPSIRDLCGRWIVKDFFTPMSLGGKKVKAEPLVGTTENPSSAMADSKATQLTEPRDSDFLKRVEKASAEEEDTLKFCAGGVFSSAAAGSLRGVIS
jgi:hypothetical protein